MKQFYHLKCGKKGEGGAMLHRNDFLSRYLRKSESKWMRRNDRMLTWITDHVLASVWMFDVALVIPLFAIPAPQWMKFVVIIVSSNWIQWWSLPALQRSANRLQAHQDAKADADHHNLLEMRAILDRLEARE